MTWRAFAVGILGVLGLCLLTPINDYSFANTYLTGNHFPVGVFFFLIILTLGVNLVLRLVRRAWMLRQSELMLVWCMMLVSSTVPASGLMRYWPTTLAAAPYLSQRPDVFWEEDVLKEAPDGILLTRDPMSVAVKVFYEGTPEGEPVRVPWSRWTRCAVTWGIFIGLYYLATFFLCGMLRKQWVESERLIFPLARVPLDFTEDLGEGRLLPPMMRSGTFLVAVGLMIVLGLARLSPLAFGSEQGWLWRVPFSNVFRETALSYLYVGDAYIYPLVIGFAFLVPRDVSLSVWLFHLFVYGEMIVAYSLGKPLAGRLTSTFLTWQQAGAFVALTVGMLWMARRHLWAVVRKAFSRAPDVDDSGEPIGYRLAFWGLVLSLGGMVAWYAWFRVGLGAGLALIALMFSIVLVHSRLVAQGGLFFVQQGWQPSMFLDDLTGGHAFSAPAAVVAQVQTNILAYDSREVLGPHVMNALRISSVFERHRRLFLPAMLAALVVGAVAAGYATMEWIYYKQGALNLPNTHSTVYRPLRMYERTHLMISSPGEAAEQSFGGLASGAGMIGLLMFLRGTFCWWPVHPLGLAVAVSWCTTQLWFSFFLGWLAKVLILKIGGGRALRRARTFFIGVIIGESTMVAFSTVVSLLTGVRTGYVFLSG